MNRKPRPVYLLVLVLAGGTLGAATVEVALRIARLGYNHSPFESDPVLHHVHPRSYEFRSYVPSGEFGGHLIRYDEAGFRVDPSAEAAADRMADTRIAVVGDSFIEALQVPFENTAAAVLDELCPQAVAKSFGVSSYSPAIYTLLWPAEIAAFEPTHVALVLFENDPKDDQRYHAAGRFGPAGDLTAVPGPERSIWFTIGRQSYLLRLVRRMYQSWAFSGPEHEDPASYAEATALTDLTRGFLRQFAAQVEDAGAELIVAVVPPRASVLNPDSTSSGSFSAQVRELCERESWTYVELEAPFRATAAASTMPLYFSTDFHWTAAGNRVAALALASELDDAGCRISDDRVGALPSS